MDACSHGVAATPSLGIVLSTRGMAKAAPMIAGRCLIGLASARLKTGGAVCLATTDSVADLALLARRDRHTPSQNTNGRAHTAAMRSRNIPHNRCAWTVMLVRLGRMEAFNSGNVCVPSKACHVRRGLNLWQGEALHAPALAPAATTWVQVPGLLSDQPLLRGE